MTPLRVIRIAICALFVLAGGCGMGARAAHPSAAETSVVRGVVREGETGELARGAELQIGGRSVTSDSAGGFMLCRVAPGEQRLTAWAGGRDTAEVRLVLGRGDTVEVNPVLLPDTVPPTSPILRRDRGTGGREPPIYILDGRRVVIDTSACANPPPGIPLLTRIPDDIAGIQVMRGDEAVERYGPGAARGVVIITTRGGRRP
jgi:hypothetical protein